jgi:hypothetical protein
MMVLLIEPCTDGTRFWARYKCGPEIELMRESPLAAQNAESLRLHLSKVAKEAPSWKKTHSDIISLE